MAIPLTPEWIDAYRRRLEPVLRPLESLAMDHVWNWFDALWEEEQIQADRLEALRIEAMPFFEAVERAPDGGEREQAIVDLVRFLRSLGEEPLQAA